MDQNYAFFLCVAIITIGVFSYTLCQEVLKYKLKKEQIKADTLVRTEEVRCKNQLEIEKLLSKSADNFSTVFETDESNTQNRRSNSERLR